MNGYGVYADPNCMSYEAIIGIKEFSTPKYNKNILKPIRCKIKDEWKNIDEVDVSMKDVLYCELFGPYVDTNNSIREIIEENFIKSATQHNDMTVDIDVYNIEYLPPLPKDNSDSNIWQFHQEERIVKPAEHYGFCSFPAVTERTSLEISYGDYLDEEGKKETMRFELAEDGKYKLVKSENHIKAWEEIYKAQPEFKSETATRQFLVYSALKAVFPNYLREIKYREMYDRGDKLILGEASRAKISLGISEEEKIDGGKLQLKLLEDGGIIPGFQIRRHFKR